MAQITKANLERVLSASAFLGYIETDENAKYPMMIENYFPIKRVAGLDFSYIKRNKGLAKLMDVSSYGSEAIMQKRRTFDAHSGDLPLFRNKMVLGEKEKSEIMNLLASSNENALDMAVKAIYDDQSELLRNALDTQEYLACQALTTGKITLANVNGSGVDVDYGVSDDNKETLSGADMWSNADAKIITQIQEWIEEVEDMSGTTLDMAVCNTSVMKYLQANTQVRETAIKTKQVGDSEYISKSKVSDIIFEQTGVRIIEHNRKISKLKADGTTEKVKMVGDNIFAMFSTESEKLGETLVGVSPAEHDANLIAGNTTIEVSRDGVAINTHTTHSAPFITTTEAEMVTIPAFYAVDEVFIGTVHA